MKKLMLITAPVTSRSGYGAHARDLVYSFIEHNKYDIKIQDVPWGQCPRNALNKNNEKDTSILNLIMKDNVLDRQPDIYVDIRIPNEFQQFGKFNIGITAGIETTAVSQNWIDSCNKMDLVIVPSEHSRDSFLKTIYDKVQNMPDGKQQKIGEVKIEKPIEVLFEGADLDVYKPLKKDEISIDFFNMLNEKVPEKFAYLFVGQWGKGGFSEDRKDIGTLIKTFYETFANQKTQPALILKTNGAAYSIIDREECLNKIRSVKSMFPSDVKLPNVYLLHGSFSDEEMNELYNHPKIRCMVSFTHGEGFGRPLLEASVVGLPVITTGFSGQIDFLDKDLSMLLNGSFQNVPESQVWKDIVIKESQWFNVDTSSATRALSFVKNNLDSVKKKSKQLMDRNRNEFSLNEMTKKLDDIINKYLKSAPTQVDLQLPKLNKVGETKSEPPKINLPKLKKIEKEMVNEE